MGELGRKGSEEVFRLFFVYLFFFGSVFYHLNNETLSETT